MVRIRPFKALRPKNEYVTRVASYPYDVVSTDEARRILKNNKLSFIGIDKLELIKESGIELKDDEEYKCLAGRLRNLKERNIFIYDCNSMYIYELTYMNQRQYGLVCTIDLEDYKNGNIKSHEETRVDKELERFKHIKYCKAHTGPIYLFQKEKAGLREELVKYASNNIPIYNFTTEDGVTHTLYQIKSQSQIQKLTDAMADINSLYIADGHHRLKAASMATAKLGDRYNESNYFMGVVFYKDELSVYPYNRAIRNTMNLSEEDILDSLKDKYIVIPCDKKPEVGLHEFAMYINGRWYKLSYKMQTQSLDVTLLQDTILSPVFNIADPRWDKNIDFFKAETNAADYLSDNELDIAFCLKGLDVDDIIKVSDAKEKLPPKSTWFFPKLLSGLLIHPF